MTTSLFDEPPSIASFRDFPTEKPFLNSNIVRSSKPATAYPKNSSEAVFSALKDLQEKIINLEMDRSKAEKNLKVLAAETSAYKTLLNQQAAPSVPPDPASRATSARSPQIVSVGRRIDGAAQIESQLRNADARCELLERQLENMRRMVQNAERERSDALERQIALERDRGRITAENRTIQSKLDKMEFIQARFDDVLSRKEKSESKIKELESRLKEEEHQRKLLIDRAAQMQTDAEAQRILSEDQSKPSEVGLKKKRKKKIAKVKKQPKSVMRPTPPLHYRLNLADVPFITGTSTSPSHAVSANMQKLLHDLKQHNPKYCNEQVMGKKVSSSSDGSSSDPEARRGRGRTAHYTTSNKEDLQDLLAALQDEFGKMMFEHQVLVKQISETCDSEVKLDLEQELDALVIKMERKGEQISTVKRHISQLTQKKCYKSKTRRSQSGTITRRAPPAATVCIGTRPSKSSSLSPRNRASEERNRRLALLKDMRSVRSALRKDDLSWDQ